MSLYHVWNYPSIDLVSYCIWAWSQTKCTPDSYSVTLDDRMMILIVCLSDVGSHHRQPGFTLGRDVQSLTKWNEQCPVDPQRPRNIPVIQGNIMLSPGHSSAIKTDPIQWCFSRRALTKGCVVHRWSWSMEHWLKAGKRDWSEDVGMASQSCKTCKFSDHQKQRKPSFLESPCTL